MVIRTRAALLREPAASASASIGRPLGPAARLPTPPEEMRGRGRAGERRPLSPFPEHKPRSPPAAQRSRSGARGSPDPSGLPLGAPASTGGRAPPLVDPPPFARVPFHPCPHPTLSKRASSVRLRL